MFLKLYSFLFLDVHLCLTFCDNPIVYKKIVHPLRMSHLRHNYNLVNNLCSLKKTFKSTGILRRIFSFDSGFFSTGNVHKTKYLKEGTVEMAIYLHEISHLR